VVFAFLLALCSVDSAYFTIIQGRSVLTLYPLICSTAAVALSWLSYRTKPICLLCPVLMSLKTLTVSILPKGENNSVSRSSNILGGRGLIYKLVQGSWCLKEFDTLHNSILLAILYPFICWIASLSSSVFENRTNP